MQRASREVSSNGQGTKQIDRAVIFHSSSSSSSTSVVQGFTTSANPGSDFQIFPRGIIESIKTGKGRASLTVQPIISSDALTQGWEKSCQGQSTGGLWSQEERKSHIHVLKLKE